MITKSEQKNYMDFYHPDENTFHPMKLSTLIDPKQKKKSVVH
jgi:hypothetical protein